MIDVTLGRKHHVSSMLSTRSTTAAKAAKDQELVNLSAQATQTHPRLPTSDHCDSPDQNSQTMLPPNALKKLSLTPCHMKLHIPNLLITQLLLAPTNAVEPTL